MSTISFDLRYAARTLTRAPWFTILAVVMVALGISLNTTLFSMLDAVLFRALPFHEPDQLVEIFGEDDTRAGMRVPQSIVEQLRTRSTTLQGITIHGPHGAVMRTAEGPVAVRGDHAWSNFNEVFGVWPALGRGFQPQDELPGAPAVLLVSHGFWLRFLGGDAAAVGRVIELDSIPYTVIGVMPPSFHTIFRVDAREHFWTTHVSAQLLEFEREEGHELFARLAPGVTAAAARRELTMLARGAGVGGWYAPPDGRRLGLRPLTDEVVGDSARALQLSFAAVALVLLIICANLALLLLARSDRRMAEFATRKAIGASSAQLLRHTLIESLLIAVIGGTAGIALSYWLLPVLVRLAPVEIPRLADATIDARVLIIAAFVTIVTACLFGAAPALRLARVSVSQALHRAGVRVTGASAALRSVLVVTQIAAAVVLCVLAGLVGRTFLTLLPTDPGFAPASLAGFVMYVDPELYPDAADRYQRLSDLAARLDVQPGIMAAGFGQNLPFSGDENPSTVRDAANTDAAQIDVDRRAISVNYFDLLNIRMRRGRTFTAADRQGAPRVAIVNETLARALDDEGAVIGRRIRVGRTDNAPIMEIVGVAPDTRSSARTLDTPAELYVPFAQSAATIAYVILRSDLSAADATAAIRRELGAVMPELPLRPDQSARTLQENIDRALAGPRFMATLSTAFSASALLLAAIGVFGLVATSVAQRRREFGIRVALGAQQRDIVLQNVRSIVILSGAGIIGGLAAAAYLMRFVATQLYAVNPHDVPTFIAAGSGILLVALLAAVVPIRRAAAVAPMAVLRED
jgi:putative ABC transport system permease protein